MTLKKINETKFNATSAKIALPFLLSTIILLVASLFNLANAANTTSQQIQSNQKGKINNPTIVVETSLGNIKVALNSDKAPKTVANFLKYVESGFYSQTIFHRVIAGFMVQGGGFDAKLNQKPTHATIEIESKNDLNNDKGTIAMARTSQPNSASSQFFINVVDNAFLNYQSDNQPGYTVFGKVIDGMDVVEKIEAVKTSIQNGMNDVPTHSVMINKVSIVD